MTLTDAYVRVNRARGLALVSPEDLLQACKMLKELNLPLTVETFDTGVIVLKSSNISDEEYNKKIVYLVEAYDKASAPTSQGTTAVSVTCWRETACSCAAGSHI